MNLAAPPPQQSIEHEVLEYMIQYPGVQGTIEDIVEWWILEVRIRRALKEVKAALERLIGLGWVTTHATRDGKTYYRMNPDKEQEILSMVAPNTRRVSTRRRNNH